MNIEFTLYKSKNCNFQRSIEIMYCNLNPLFLSKVLDIHDSICLRIYIYLSTLVKSNLHELIHTILVILILEKFNKQLNHNIAFFVRAQFISNKLY